MKIKRTVFYILPLAAILFGLSASQIFAQPSNAQLKKQLSSAGTVSITLGDPGRIEWSSTYKKYVWTRNFTVKLKGDEPGVFLIVKGYAAYDVMGGRYVYWRTFTSSNSYEGKANPTISEINQALEKADQTEFNPGLKIIGEFESLKLAEAPNWEWHTPNSVSFYAIAVFWMTNSYLNFEGAPNQPLPTGFGAIDKVQKVMRLRIYRKDEKSPWNSAVSTVVGPLQIPDAKGRMIDRFKLLERKNYRYGEIEKMPRMTKVPILTQ
ncbi:MAG: hypothetical protein ABJA66_07575 [Actinomycetota bacterium]